jgi:hypothetical protein
MHSWESKQQSGASGAPTVGQPDHPGSLLARANLVGPGPRRTGKHFATDVGTYQTLA